jgi:hypothetical protein
MVASVPVEVDYDLTLLARRLARLFPDLHHFAIQEQGSSLERFSGEHMDGGVDRGLRP